MAAPQGIGIPMYMFALLSCESIGSLSFSLKITFGFSIIVLGFSTTIDLFTFSLFIATSLFITFLLAHLLSCTSRRYAVLTVSFFVCISLFVTFLPAHLVSCARRRCHAMDLADRYTTPFPSNLVPSSYYIVALSGYARQQ